MKTRVFAMLAAMVPMSSFCVDGVVLINLQVQMEVSKLVEVIHGQLLQQLRNAGVRALLQSVR